MNKLVLSLAAIAALCACTPAVDEQVIGQTENAIREGLAAQGTVKQVELTRDSDDRMTGFALVEPHGAPGTEVRLNCTAERQGQSGAQFNWRCDQPAAPAAGGKDAQAGAGGGAAGPGRAALIGRWTDTGDCGNVTFLGEDGVFVANDGGRGQWELQGDRLTLSGAGGTISWSVYLEDPNTLMLIDDQGGRARSTRC